MLKSRQNSGYLYNRVHHAAMTGLLMYLVFLRRGSFPLRSGHKLVTKVTVKDLEA